MSRIGAYNDRMQYAQVGTGRIATAPLTPVQVAAAVVGVLLLPVAAQAVGAGAGLAMPWIAPLQGLLDTLSGPTARVLAGLAFVIGAGLLALGRAEEGAKKFGMVVVGASIAIAAANVVNAFAFAGAVVGG